MKRFLTILGVLVMAYVAYNNLWAEPSKPEPIITPAFAIEMQKAESENEITLEIEHVMELSDEELNLLARCVEAEAATESIIGKCLVTDTILNRVDDPRFPNSITDVIMQNGQFETVSNGMIDAAIPTETTYNAIVLELTHRTDSSVIYFRTGRFHDIGTPVTQAGRHYFSK